MQQIGVYFFASGVIYRGIFGENVKKIDKLRKK